MDSTRNENRRKYRKNKLQKYGRKFAMPFEFPIALALTSQNPQFALAVVNLVEDSRIIITIAESKTTTTTTTTEKYTQRVEQSTVGSEGGVNSSQVVSQGVVEGQPQVSTEETYTTDIFYQVQEHGY